MKRRALRQIIRRNGRGSYISDTGRIIITLNIDALFGCDSESFSICRRCAVVVSRRLGPVTKTNTAAVKFVVKDGGDVGRNIAVVPRCI